MTKNKFKKGINIELKDNGFTNLVKEVNEEGVNTTMQFNEGINFKLLKWLNNRFQYGISIDNTYSLIYINTPLQGKVEL